MSGADERGSAIDVLIVGAGPTGLCAAIAALRQGLRVRIVDRAAERSSVSKALVLHARSMEALDHLGCVEPMLRAGRDFRALHVLDSRGELATIEFASLRWGDVPYPRWWTIEQSSTERCLEEQLAAMGVRVERRTSVRALREQGDRVRVELEREGDGDGEREGERERVVIEAPWVIGCDGARSTVRDAVGVTMESHSSDAVFVLADVEVRGALRDAEGYNVMAEEGVLLLVPLEAPGRIRVIAHRPDLRPGDEPVIDRAALQALIDRRCPLAVTVDRVGWTSRFVARHGVASAFRVGRVFLAGDAAHVHSPVGGQGLNTGIQDAFALAWRIAAVHQGRAPRAVLDGYERERRANARAMVRAVRVATAGLTLRGSFAVRARNGAARLGLGFSRARDRMGAGVGMLGVRYAVEGDLVRSEPGARFRGADAGERAPLCASVPSLREAMRGADAVVLCFGDDAMAERARAVVGAHARVVTVRERGGAVEDPRGVVRAAYGARGPLLVWVRPDRVVAMRGALPALERYARAWTC